MSTELEVLDQPTLDELAVLIREEMGSAGIAFKTSIEHAVRAGEYLLKAMEMFPGHREFGDWMAETFPELTAPRLRSYMRLAKYRDKVEARGYHSIQGALVGIQGEPQINRRIDPSEARAMRDEGLTYEKIGHQIGFTTSAVWNALNKKDKDDYKDRQRRKKADERAAKLAEYLRRQDAAVKRRGGSAAEAYSLIRRAAQALESALGSEANLDAKKSLNAAMASLYNAEDRIGHAMRNEYQQSMPARSKRATGDA